jgi:hypothetical protein
MDVVGSVDDKGGAGDAEDAENEEVGPAESSSFPVAEAAIGARRNARMKKISWAVATSAEGGSIVAVGSLGGEAAKKGRFPRLEGGRLCI